MRDPKPDNRNVVPSLEQTEALLRAWGARIRETAAYRKQNRVLDRSLLVRRLTRAYRLWDRVFRLGLAFTALVLVVGLIAVFRSLQQAPPANGSRPSGPAVSMMLTGFGAGPASAPVEDLQNRLHMVLTSLQKPHRACPRAPERIDFAAEYEIVQSLYRAWALRVGSFEDPYGQAVRQLGMVLLPCLRPQQAEFLRDWARDTKQSLYLGWNQGLP